MAHSEGRVQLWCLLRRRSALAALLLAEGAGCTALAPGADRLTQQPEPLETADGAATPPDPKWGCLDGPEPAGAVALRPTVGFSLRLNEPTTASSPPGASLRACNRFDIECLTPVAGPVLPSADGLLHLELPQDFAGFLEITSPAIVPVLYFFNPPLRTDRQDEFMVVSFATAAGLAASGNVELNPELGMIAVRTMDCTGEYTAGVEFSNNVGGIPFAFVDGLPAIGFMVSDADGIGGFVNLPPGLVVLQGQEVGSGRVTGTSSVIVRPGWFAYGDLNPASP